MTDEEIKERYENIIESKEYKIKIITLKTFWKGYDSGKQEDAPGIFLKTKIYLVDVKRKKSDLEVIAINKKVVLYKTEREVTSEPREYVKLKHRDFIREVKNSPEYYLQDLQKKVKESL